MTTLINNYSVIYPIIKDYKKKDKRKLVIIAICDRSYLLKNLICWRMLCFMASFGNLSGNERYGKKKFRLS